MAGFLVGDIVRNAARAVPDRVAVMLDDASLTFDQLDRRSNATVRRLANANLGLGDRVAVWGTTSLEMVVVFAACAKAGIVFVPMNPALHADEAQALVCIARPSAIVADAPRMDAARALGSELEFTALALEGMVDAESNEGLDEELDDRAPHVIFFTSGSTGQPKGAVLSHRVNVLRTHPGAQFEPRGPTVCMFPLFHMAGWTIAMQQWQARGAVILVHSPDAAALIAAVEHHRAERLNCIPLVWRRILDHLGSGQGSRDALASLRFADTGTSATPVEFLRSLQAAVPQATVRVFYGSTEAGNVMTLDAAHFEHKPGSVGVPSLHTQVRISETGELEVRSPLLFDGYFEDAGATAVALGSGWYRTGDLAEIDSDGFVTIVGRANTVIRTGGEGVVPAEVEAALREHPAIDDVAVVGVPDEGYGEIVCAVIVTRPAVEAPTLDDLREFLGDRLAGFKLPRRLQIAEVIPRTTATGQVQRHLVVDRLVR